MVFSKAAIVGVALGSLVALSAVSAGWAQQQPPRPRQDQQSAPGPMGPGMIGGPMMGTMPTGDMSQMMETCIQMMNQMGAAMSTPPPQPGQGGR